MEEIINKSLNSPKLEKLTHFELEIRAKAANNDIKNGDVYSQDELEKLAQSW